MGRGGAYVDEARRKAAGRPAMHGTCPNVGEGADDPGRHAGEAEPIDIIGRVAGGLPPDRAHSLGQAPRYRPGAGGKDDMDAGPGKADSCAHRLAFGRWRSR